MQEVNKKLIEEALKITESVYSEAIESPLSRVHKLLKRALAPEPELYYNQQVLVSDGSVAPILPALFRKYEDGLFVVDIVDDSDGESTWEHCIPDPNAVTLPVWIEHDESITLLTPPEGAAVMCEYDTGGIHCSPRQIFLSVGVIRYCFVPLAVYGIKS